MKDTADSQNQLHDSGSLLVSLAKSSRLQALRAQAKSVEQPITPAPVAGGAAHKSNLDPLLLLAQELIDQRLAEILAVLPAGMQKRLFKIRFGVELDEIRQLPLKRLLPLLKIQHSQLNNPPANMKRIADLNYNGQPVN